MIKKVLVLIMTFVFVFLALTGCGDSAKVSKPSIIKTKLSKPDKNKWLYNKQFDIYYQVGIDYCEKPADDKYERLAIFVPGSYMDAKKNSKGTFTCNLNDKKISGYTSSTAPIVFPIITPAYSSAGALTEKEISNFDGFFDDISTFTSKGFVYVYAGCRGGYEGAPAGVTDLKAAIRYLRYCDDVIAGSAENIFACGMSGGGAQAAILGASGNSKLYDPYLKAIGAVKGASDAIKGSMNWCPITDLDTANAEYEWMMGCTRPKRSKDKQAISDNLAKAFAEYINKAGFIDKNGKNLSLTKSKTGVYQAGTYYEYIKGVIEKSLNNYLKDTDFIYGTAQDYIDSLNSEGKWIVYDKKTNTAKIDSIASFAKNCKQATDELVAFDRPEIENKLFGFGKGKGAHFDRILANILTKLKSKYASAYNADLKKTDFVGNNVEKRVQMYTPLYYLMKSRKGYKTSDVAKYWRIRSGIEQVNTSITTEVNLALALQNYEGVKSVDFETVWAKDHTEAERVGDSTSNFIKWVNACMNKE